MRRDLSEPATAEIYEVERLRALHDALERLRDAVIEHLNHDADRTATALMSAYRNAHLHAELASSEVMRAAALYAVYQCGRATGPLEDALPRGMRPGLLREVDWALDAANDAIAERIRDLGSR
jgi:hypothetical protein